MLETTGHETKGYGAGQSNGDRKISGEEGPWKLPAEMNGNGIREQDSDTKELDTVSFPGYGYERKPGEMSGREK